MPRLELETWGHVYVGGGIDGALDGAPMVGQLYAEYWVPAERAFEHPVVMVHGARQTGTNFTRTPDGREGWAQYFVRHGATVYVVDQVACGRSGGWPRFGETAAPTLAGTQDRFVAPGRADMWSQATMHTQWPGSGRPGDRAFDQFYASQTPSLADRAQAAVLNRDALIALLDEIGPAVLLVHSQAGAFAWPVADARPALVKAIVAVEPAGPPVHEVATIGPPEWFEDTGSPRPWGLGRLPLTYDPPLAEGDRLRFVQQSQPDHEGQARCWLQAEPPRRLPNLQEVPVLIVTTEASYHAIYDHCTAAFLRQAGVDTTMVHLSDRGIRGNGHMMMLERNSDDIAAVIHGWLTETLGG